MKEKMTKKILSIATIAILAVGTAMFISCEKEGDVSSIVKETNYTISTKSSEDIAGIDKMSSEIADFHDIAMDAWIYKMGSDVTPWDENYYAKVIDLLKSVANQYNFSELDRSFLLHELTTNAKTYNMIADIATGPEDDFIAYFTNTPQSTLNNNLVLQKTNTIFDSLEILFVTAKSYDEFEKRYTMMVDFQVSDISNKDDYAAVRFYSDLALSSLNTWGNYFFGTNEYAKAKDKKKWFENVCASLKYTWDNYLKEPVKADAVGGLSATVTAITSGVYTLEGIGTAFAAGAAVSSISKIIDMLTD